MSTHLVRYRTLVFSPRAPFALIPEIPKSATKNADGTAGGVWGGMPCRPPSVVCDDVIFSPECDFAFLREWLDAFRTVDWKDVKHQFQFSWISSLVGA